MAKKEQNQVLYQLSVVLLDKMLGEGLISRNQYQKIDQKNRVAFGISFFK